MAPWIILIVLLAFSSIGESAQPTFETSLTGARQATSAGEAKKALRYFETQAAKFEQSARSEETPRASLEAASRAYREASNSAFFLGDLQKALDYGEKAFALGSEIDNPRLKLTAISSLHRAHRDLKNASRARELIELGLKIAQELSPGSINRVYWEAVFYAARSSDFRAQREYQKAIEDAQRSISLYKDFLSSMRDSRRRSESRKETAITNMALLYGRLGRTYLAMGNTDEALKQYELGLELAQRGNLKFSQVYLFQGLGDVYAQRQEYPEALKHFKKALELAREQQRLDAISEAACRIGDMHRKAGENLQAIASYSVAIEKIESIRSLLSS
jgi:tetratricopeptide (TPR) repeat protein